MWKRSEGLYWSWQHRHRCYESNRRQCGWKTETEEFTDNIPDWNTLRYVCQRRRMLYIEIGAEGNKRESSMRILQWPIEIADIVGESNGELESTLEMDIGVRGAPLGCMIREVEVKNSDPIIYVTQRVFVRSVSVRTNSDRMKELCIGSYYNGHEDSAE